MSITGRVNTLKGITIIRLYFMGRIKKATPYKLTKRNLKVQLLRYMIHIHTNVIKSCNILLKYKYSLSYLKLFY